VGKAILRGEKSIKKKRQQIKGPVAARCGIPGTTKATKTRAATDGRDKQTPQKKRNKMPQVQKGCSREPPVPQTREGEVEGPSSCNTIFAQKKKGRDQQFKEKKLEANWSLEGGARYHRKTVRDTCLDNPGMTT